VVVTLHMLTVLWLTARQAETKGRLYRRIASELSFQHASPAQFRADTLTTTAIATCPPFAYTVSKDMTLVKWELCTPISPQGKPTKSPHKIRKRPNQVAYVKGNNNKAHDNTYQGHVDQILTVAASADGKFVVTGGRDRRVIVWDATDLKPLRVFTQHRDAITGLAFRRGTNQLYSSAKDRTIKTWSLDELAYVETLFGHQDEVVDVAALAQERCISVGARDRTARLWKVVEETQLVFRGGGGEKKSKNATSITYAEGSMDRVAMIDEEMFVTGCDNGSLLLFTLHKKKPIFTVPLAHGLDPPLRPDEASADQNPDPVVPSPPQPRWITALATIPYSDVILSGSWDGHVRAWKVSDDKRRIEPLGAVGVPREPAPVANGIDGHQTNGDHDARKGSPIQAAELGSTEQPVVRGVINDLSVFERGERGKDGICIVAAVGTEHRLGRWKKMKGKNGAVVFEVGRAPPAANIEVGGDGKDATLGAALT